MKQLTLIIVIYLFISCQKKVQIEKSVISKDQIEKSFISFEFRSLNIAENFIIKYNGGDTIYLKRISPKEENLLSVLTQNEKKDLIESLKKSNFNYSRNYWNNSVDDGQIYEFHIEHLDKTKDSILVHEEIGPKKLYDLAKKMNDLLDKKKFENK